MLRSSLAARLTTAAIVVLAAAAVAVPAFARSQVTTTKVAVTATEFHFKLSRASAPHGVVVFTVTNKGATAHNFKIGGHATKLISPGSSAKLSVKLAKGRYKYLCTVAGHAAAGMKGTFVVK
jgi:plastocyanin